mgnify:FL=1
MNEYFDLISNFRKLYYQIDDCMNQYREEWLPYQSPYMFTSNMDIMDYNNQPQIVDIIQELRLKFKVVDSVEVSNKLDNKGSIVVNEEDDYNKESMMGELKSIKVGEYLIYKTKYDVCFDGVNEKELIAYKNISSAIEPSIISTSGKALFKLFDNDTRSYKFIDDEYLVKRLDIEIDKPFFEWDDMDFGFLKLNLPGPVK